MGVNKPIIPSDEPPLRPAMPPRSASDDSSRSKPPDPPVTAAASPIEEPPELAAQPYDGEETHTRRYLNPRHKAIAELLMDLAKTARSFILYDPRNDAIRDFLTALLQSFVHTLSQEGEVKLAIQPFEIWFEGEVIYLNRDRERSLAFRLYRDGVRSVTFKPGFDWEELTRLLEVLSIRYTGVHQNEDDVVTLLWKAGFEHMEIVAVEGFIPHDVEEPELPAPAEAGDVTVVGEAPATARRKGHPVVGLAALADMPRPHLPEFESVEWGWVPQERLAELRDEASERNLPDTSLALLARLREMLDDPSIKCRFSEFAHLFTEIRDFFLANEHLPYLEKLIALLTDLSQSYSPPWDTWRQDGARKVLSGCGDEPAVRKLLHTVPVESRRLPEEMVRVIEQVCAEPLDVVLNTFVAERSTGARAFARQLIERFGADRMELLLQRFEDLNGTVASDLLRAIANIDGQQQAHFIARQTWHPDPDVQDEALRHIEKIPYSGQLGRLLAAAVKRVDPVKRIRILKLIVKSRDARFAEPLARFVEADAENMTPADAEQIGRVMGKLGGRSYFHRWRSWLEPAGLMRKTLKGPLARQVAAAAAIGEIPGPEALNALRDAFNAAGDSALEWITRAIGRNEARAGRKGSA